MAPPSQITQYLVALKMQGIKAHFFPCFYLQVLIGCLYSNRNAIATASCKQGQASFPS